MIRFIFRILPWWGYLALAVLAGLATLGVYEDYDRAQREAALAQRAGPPPIIPLQAYDPNRSPGPLGEVHVSGVLRADLGVRRVEGDVVDTSYVVMDSGAGRGPLMALLFVGGDAQDGIATLVTNAGRDGSVTVRGFKRTLDQSAIQGQLALRGETRDVVLVEPYFGDRNAALSAKAGSDLPFLIGFAALTALLGLVALWRFRRWRDRVAARFAGQAANRRRVKSRSAQSAPAAAARTSTAAKKGPWSGKAPKEKALPTRRTEKFDFSDEKLPDNVTEDPILPDNPLLMDVGDVVPEMAEKVPTVSEVTTGQPFRFKTPEEIILATFGRVTSLDPVKRGK